MKLAILIPDRGDRPKFMENCLRMMSKQTLQPYHIEIVDYPAKDDQVDITPRYRTGYDNLRDKGFDLIAFIENDDWYDPQYLETMVKAWIRFNKPELFGTNYTIYYHLQLKAYFTFEHHDRSSAMNTFIKPDMQFPWPVDLEPFLDMFLWRGANPLINGKHYIKQRIVFRPERHLSVGMKHGVGKTIAGGNHIKNGREVILKNMFNWGGPKKGYYYVDIWMIGKIRKAKTVHRLVAEAFIKNPKKKPQVDHINNIKTDNRVENLQWLTNAENVHKYFSSHHAYVITGENNFRAKMTNKQVRQYRTRYLNGEKGIDLAKEAGVTSGAMSLAVNGKTYKNAFV